MKDACYDILLGISCRNLPLPRYFPTTILLPTFSFTLPLAISLITTTVSPFLIITAMLKASTIATIQVTVIVVIKVTIAIKVVFSIIHIITISLALPTTFISPPLLLTSIGTVLHK